MRRQRRPKREAKSWPGHLREDLVRKSRPLQSKMESIFSANAVPCPAILRDSHTGIEDIGGGASRRAAAFLEGNLVRSMPLVSVIELDDAV